MTRRFEGFLAEGGLFVLDTWTGEVRLATTARGPSATAGVTTTVVPTVNVTPIVARATPSVSGPAPANPEASPVERATPEVSMPPTASVLAPALQMPASADAFDREVALTFPYPIARPWFGLLCEPNPRVQCKHLVDTFTAVLKMLALVVATEYLCAPEVRDAAVHKTLARDLQRPLISAWNLVLQRTLPVLADAGVEHFAPELPRAYERLETKCRQRFLVTEQYEDESGTLRTRTKKLGKIQALINYRNSLAHGFNQSPERARRELATYLPVLREVLEETRFFTRYSLFHVRAEGEVVEAVRLHGATPPQRFEPMPRTDFDPRVSPLFLRNEATGDTLPLFAFFDVDTVEDGGLPGLGQDVFVFEGNTKSTVVYVSTGGEHREKASRLAHWRDALARKAIDVEVLSAETLTLAVLRTVAARVTSGALDALVQSGKYLREATVDRPDLDALLSQFDAGRYGAFVLGGESGIGKSTLLARRVEHWCDEGHAVAFYRASALASPDIASRLLRDLGVAGSFPYAEDFLAAATALFSEAGRRFYLVIDAVNEFPGEVAALVRAVDALVQQAAGHDWFRVVVSVRDGAYQRMASDARFGYLGLAPYFTVEEEVVGTKTRTAVVRLLPVATSQVEALYEAYRNFRQRDPYDPDDPGTHRFRPTTAFGELAAQGSTRALLRSPLMARLVLAAFHRRALPSDLRMDHAMRLHLEHVVVEAHAPGGGFPERRRFLTALVKELDRASSDSLPRDVLASTPALRPFFHQYQRDGAYVQLLELGVLLEEWDGDTCSVRFAFDRFFEHLLAALHEPKVQGAEDALALVRRATEFRSLRGALEAVLGRACEEGREVLVVGLLDVVGEGESAVHTLAREVVSALVVSLATGRDAAFGRLLVLMPEAPSATDVDVLCAAADRLALIGEVAALEAVLDAVNREAEALGDARRLADAKTRLALRAETTGEIERALTLHQGALALRELAGDRQGTANNLRQLGLLASDRGDLGEAERLYRASLEIKEQLGDKKGIATSLYNLGLLTSVRGDLVEGERLHRASLEITEQLGDKKGMAMCLNILGLFASDRGDLTEAERLHRASLEIMEQLGDKKGIAAALQNLAPLTSSSRSRKSRTTSKRSPVK